MNLKYRKKPVTIEAFQLTADRWEDNRDWPSWLHEAWNSGVFFPDKLPIRIPTIKTLEGNHIVTLGDFIIQGVKGELYPCKPDIFYETYEDVP